MRILLIEDSKRLAGSIRSGLCKLGHAVDLAFDGKTGLSYALHNPYDVVVLDLMLPRMAGLEVLERIRDEGMETHVLVLTAKRTVDDRVRGLQAGADDYVVKPFSFDELAARIEAFWRKDAARSDRGHAGLGLTLVSSIVRVLGVDLRFELEERFKVKLLFPLDPLGGRAEP